MSDPIRVFVSRAPALIPCLCSLVRGSDNPLVLVPESFTLAAEQALVDDSERKGLIGTQVLSPTSLIREIRERAGFPDQKVITGDGRHMIISLILLKNKDKLTFYRENVNQAGMAEKIASQIDDLEDGGFDSASLLAASDSMKNSTRCKCRDIALIWEEYRKVLDSGFIDKSTSWAIALDRLGDSGLLQDTDLIICGFDCINMNLTRLAAAAAPLARSVSICLVSETGRPDDHIFELASNSVNRFLRRITGRRFGLSATLEHFSCERGDTDPGLRFLEQSVYALEKPREEVPDLSAVRVYYAPGTYTECLYAAQTLMDWHRQGIPWHDMAVAICDETAIPSMLPLVLASCNIPFSQRNAVSMLHSEYAQFFLAVLRCMRTDFKQEEVLRLIKSGFAGLDADDVMELENHARSHGIDRAKWLKPFKGEDEKTLHLEELRRRLITPLQELKARLGANGCTGRDAAREIFTFMTGSGAYEILLRRERELIDDGMLSAADQNRQVWTAVNELLDQLALFAGDDHLPLTRLAMMLESSLSARMIKSLPQVADSVMVSSPNMFFTTGFRAAVLIGMQETGAIAPSSLLTPSECARLSKAVSGGQESAGIGMTRREAAARARQDIYQALAAVKERLLISCSAATSAGKVLTASQAYRDISQLVHDQHPENVRGGLTKDDLVPFSPQFALERLAVMLREARRDGDSFLTLSDPESRQWRQALSFLYSDENWHGRMQAVLDALHVTLQSPGIPADLASKLYQQTRLSVSSIQTAGTCLYQAFLSYALRLHIRRDFTFEADLRGTFSHLVMKRFFEEAMKLPGWPVLEEKAASRLLDRIFTEETREWRDGPLGKNTSGRYRGGEIIRTVRTAVQTLVRALQEQPHFSPIGMEVGFGETGSDSPMRLPEVLLRLEDGRQFSLSGIIDRIDTVTFQDGEKAVLVYDYKSSDKEVHRQALTEGLQIQLPVYLMAIRQGMPDYTLAGALYQPVRQVLVEAEDADAAAIESGISKTLCAKGIYLDDERIQKAGSPLKIPRRIVPGSDLINVLSPEGLDAVIDEGAASAARVITRMMSGDTTPNPVQDGMSSPCTYCRMADACPLDSRLEGGRVRRLGDIAAGASSDAAPDTYGGKED